MSNIKNVAEHAIGYFNLTKMKSKNALKSGNKTFTEADVEAGWFKFSGYLNGQKVATTGLTPASTYKAALDHLSNKPSAPSNSKFRNYEDTFDFVNDNLESSGIVLDELGRVDLSESENPIDYLYLLADKYNREAKVNDWNTVTPTLIDRVMNIIRVKTPKTVVANIVTKYKYDGSDKSATFIKLCKLLVPDASHEMQILHAEALKHYIWQIKRKLSGKTVLDPLMIYISGNQGVGKSSILRKINQEVLGEFFLEQDITDMLDSRSTESKQNYYSVLADEIQYCDANTIAKIKKLLTAPSESARVLGTNAVMKVKNNTTWAATSNHSLMTTIYEETGMRRFWEIQSTIPRGSVIDWEALDKIDISELWRSIDENLEGGYYNRNNGYWDSMRAHQDKSVAKSNAHAFLYTKGYILENADSYVWCSGSDLFKQYTAWAEDNNIKGKGQSRLWFNRKLEELGIPKNEFERELYFYVSSDNNSVRTVEGSRPVGKSVTISTTNGKNMKQLPDTNKFSKVGDIKKFSEDT